MAAKVLLEAAGQGWVVHVAGSAAPTELSELAASLPAEPDMVAVAVAPEVDLTSERILTAVVTRLRRDAGLGRNHRGVRLLVPHSAGGPDSTAAILSARLKAPVSAPDGPLWIGVDGSLFVGPGVGDDGAGRWWRFAPSGTVQPSGPRHPAPPWQPDPGSIPWSGAAEIPAGWWLTGRDSRAPLVREDLAFDLLPAPNRSLLLIGDPDGDPVTAEAVIDHLARLPVEHRGTCLLTGYDTRQQVPRLAAEAARKLGEPVRFTGGLPLLAEDGTEHLLLLDGDELIPYGYAAVLEATPDGLWHVLNSRPPVTGWPARQDHVWPLTGDCMLEVIPSGLWLRPEGLPAARAEQVRRQPWSPRTIMVTVEENEPPPPAVRTHLMARLPAEHRDRVRFAGPGAPRWPGTVQDR